MHSTTNSVRRPLGGVLLLLGLFTVLQMGDVVSAAEEPKNKTDGLPCEIPAGQNAAHAEQDAKQKSSLVTGEVMQIDGEHFVVKDKNGKEVRFQVTATTEKPPVQQGDRISVSVDSQNRALWIRGNRATDRRAEHVSADCNPTEDVSSEALKQADKTSQKKR
jgi:ATP-dependent 26S proteasome regulatory subunit